MNDPPERVDELLGRELARVHWEDRACDAGIQFQYEKSAFARGYCDEWDRLLAAESGGEGEPS